MSYDWGTTPPGYRARETTEGDNCPITWPQRPSGFSWCSTNDVIRFADQYADRYGNYSLLFNNCHHFVNRLATMLESSKCSTPGRGNDATTGLFSGIIDTLGSWWTGFEGGEV